MKTTPENRRDPSPSPTPHARLRQHAAALIVTAIKTHFAFTQPLLWTEASS